MNLEWIKIHSDDTVGVALKELVAGNNLDGTDLALIDNIPAGHKFALHMIGKGDKIIKYGMPIGYAKESIPEGKHVHTHNLTTALSGTLEYTYTPAIQIRYSGLLKERSFMGYMRENGEVGIRNELWIVPLVGCVNGIGNLIMNQFKSRNPEKEDVFVFSHNYGCSQLGDDHINTRTILQDIVKHPNGGGVLIIALGCENNNIEEFKKTLGDYPAERIRFLHCQDSKDEVADGLAMLEELYNGIKEMAREEISLAKLRVGLKCGASDGLSGITANPLLGVFTDYHTSFGGTAVLTEVPEMFGAETILMSRAESENVFKKTVSLINGFKDYFASYNQPVYENPSPGNKSGGISTLEEKSLGCIQKAGNATVVDVLNYGGRLKKSGLNLLDSPGNDLVATTALGASGCQIVLFTTGRGTPFGGFVPTMKVATNTNLSVNKKHWIDFNAGCLADGEPMERTIERFLEKIIQVANGEKLHHEISGNKEIAIFKNGVTL